MDKCSWCGSDFKYGRDCDRCYNSEFLNCNGLCYKCSDKYRMCGRCYYFSEYQKIMRQIMNRTSEK